MPPSKYGESVKMANDIAQQITALSEIPKIAADTLFPVVEDPDGPGKKTKKAPASKVNKSFIRTADEISAGVTPIDFRLMPSPIRDISRYVSDNTGATDIGAEFQDAINVAKNELIIPDGVYRTNQKLTLVNGTVISGNRANTVIEFGANIVGFELDGVSNVYLINFKIDGQRATFTTITNKGIFSPANGTGSTDIWIEGIEVFDIGGAGIQFLAQAGSHSIGIHFRDIYVHETGSIGMQCQDFIDFDTWDNIRIENSGLAVADRPGLTTGRNGKHHILNNIDVTGSPSALGSSVHGVSLENGEDFVINNYTGRTNIGFGLEIAGAQGVTGSCINIHDNNRAGVAIRGSTQMTVGVNLAAVEVERCAASSLDITQGGGRDIAVASADAGTNTTTIVEAGALGAVEIGDKVVNATRSDAISYVSALIDANSVTISPAITGQTTGDVIRIHALNKDIVIDLVSKTAVQIGANIVDAENVTITGEIVDSGRSGIFCNLSNHITLKAKVRDNNTTDNASDAGVRIVNTKPESDYHIDCQVSGSGIADYTIDNPIIARRTHFKTTIPQFINADATPSVANGESFRTVGTTQITDFDDGIVGDTRIILAESTIIITHGTPIQLRGNVNFDMVSGDVLTIHMFNNQIWEETSRKYSTTLETYTPSNATTDRIWDANAAVNGTGIDVAAAGPANVALLSDHDALVAVVQELSDVVATLTTDLKSQDIIQ